MSLRGPAARLLALCLLIAFVSGCASVRPGLVVNQAGPSDPEWDEAILYVYHEASRQGIVVPRDDVLVFVSSAPAGLRFDGDSLVSTRAHNHEVLATFAMRPKSRNVIPVEFRDYRKSYLKAYGYWQVPLTWVSLALWSFVPVAYPCWADHRSSKVEFVREARILARASGGDSIILRYSGEQARDAWSAWGFVVRLDKRWHADQNGEELPAGEL